MQNVFERMKPVLSNMVLEKDEYGTTWLCVECGHEQTINNAYIEPASLFMHHPCRLTSNSHSTSD